MSNTKKSDRGAETVLDEEAIVEFIHDEEKWLNWARERKFTTKTKGKENVNDALKAMAVAFALEGHPVGDPFWKISPSGYLYDQVRAKVLSLKSEIMGEAGKKGKSVWKTDLAMSMKKDCEKINATYSSTFYGHSNTLPSEKLLPSKVDLLALRAWDLGYGMDEVIHSALVCTQKMELAKVPRIEDSLLASCALKNARLAIQNVIELKETSDLNGVRVHRIDVENFANVHGTKWKIKGLEEELEATKLEAKRAKEEAEQARKEAEAARIEAKAANERLAPENIAAMVKQLVAEQLAAL